MTAENLTQKILEKIKEDKIEPKPKWQFLIKAYSIWVFFGLSVLIGSLSFAVMIFIIFNDATFELLKDNWLKNILQTLPYFWIALLVVFIFIAYFNLKHTKTGYRINPYGLIALSIVASLLLGSLIYAFGDAQMIEKITYNKIPLYKNLANRQAQIWVEPQNGRLGGVIMEVSISDNKFELRDFRGQSWVIIIQENAIQSQQIPEPEFIKVPCPKRNCQKPYTRIRIGDRVGLIGEQLTAEEFFAIKILPLMQPPSKRLHFMKENN